MAINTVELARDLRVLVGRLRRRVKEVADTYELTPSQLAVVSRLDREGPATASDLAAAERVRPQSMAATVAVLDERGWLVRRPDPADGRKQLLSLNDTAREHLYDSRQVRDEWLGTALTDRYTEAERATIAKAIDLLGRLTGKEVP
jgi:DNA-binding MarR family transcriptional regulator